MPNNQIQSLTISGTTYDIVDNTSGYITADSPALTGTPTAPTPLSGASDTQIATVKYVQDSVSGAGAGTVTSVGVANATDGGLSVSGSPVTSSGTISVGHSNVLASAQTTSGIYPIKIDKNGHISEYGNAVSIPTKTSDLTNDSGFISSYTETDPVFSASAAAGITSTDISNWNAKVSDDKTWNGVGLGAGLIQTVNDLYVPANSDDTVGSGTMYHLTMTHTPTSQAGVKYDADAYLYSTTPSASDNSTKVATTAYVDSAITTLPEPMIFKGSLGTGGTITSLPTASSLNEGFTYKVITDGTYDSQSAKIGDTFISDGNSWILIPSGDEPSGTVTSVGVSNATDGGLSISGSPITSSGTISIGHSNVLSSAQTTQAVYPIEIDKNGHISAYGNAVNIPSKTSDLTNDSGFITGMTILSYGSSTWQNFIDAYDANKVVYCRASSNSNPASGSQTRLAFMAYVNNATTPTEVEFQYYRSVSTHTASQQGDQVYVYKLNKTAGWSVTVREASVKVVAGTGLGGTYSNGTMTLTGPTKVSDLTNDSGFVTTDEKLAVAEVTSGTTYYPIVGSGTTAATRQYDTTGFIYVVKTGTSSANGWSSLILGNNKTSGTAGNKQGYLTLYGENGQTSTLKSGAINNNSEIALPDSSGTLALQEDMIPIGSIPSTYMNILLTTNTADTKNKYYDAQSGLQYYSSYSTGGSQGYAGLVLGNNITSGTAYNAKGIIYLYGNSTYSTAIDAKDSTAARNISFPDKSGTVALTSDIPTVPTITLNGSTTTTPSFYAPTSAGTNGYVLKSNGSGAPTWTSATLTDEKVKTTPTTLDVLNGYLTFSSSATETTNTLNKHSSIQIAIDADTVINGQTQLTLGNTIVEGDSGAKIGVLELYGPNQYMVRLTPDTLTDTRLIKLPNKAGTIALTSDIPTVPTIYLNDAPATLYSFYAPTTAGTSGYYLKSNGSGAPTWAAIPAGVTVTLNGSTTTTPSFYAPTTAGTSGQVLTSSGSGAPTWNGPDFIVEDSSETIAPLATVTVSNRDSRYAYTDFSIIFNGPNYYSTLSIVFDNTTYICDLFNQDDEYVYGSLDFSDCPFILYGELSGNSVPMNLYLPSDSAQTHTIIIKTPGTLSVTTSSDFDAAVIHVLETNLQSVEGGSY